MSFDIKQRTLKKNKTNLFCPVRYTYGYFCFPFLMLFRHQQGFLIPHLNAVGQAGKEAERERGEKIPGGAKFPCFCCRSRHSAEGYSSSQRRHGNRGTDAGRGGGVQGKTLQSLFFSLGSALVCINPPQQN